MDATMQGAWLVEIRINNWEPDLPGATRTVAYEEVHAADEAAARKEAYSQFSARCGFEPAMRRKMQAWGITQYNCSAFDAVRV